MWLTIPFLLLLGAWKVLAVVADVAEIPAARSVGRACALVLMVGCYVFPTPFRQATLEFVEQEAKPVVERMQRSLQDLVPAPPTTTRVQP